MAEAQLNASEHVTITSRGADRLRAGHVWVYRSDIIAAKDVPAGALATVQELSDKNVRRAQQVSPARTRPPRILGSALYSTASEIALRMISTKPVNDLEGLVRKRIRAAIGYRERLVQDTNAYRVIFSEGDFLPGLIVDRYNDILSLQVLTQAMDAGPMREIFLSELKHALSPATIIERVDPRVRRLEQLPAKDSGLIWEDTLEAGSIPESGATGVSPVQPNPAEITSSPGRGRPRLHKTSSAFQMNGIRFVYEAFEGQKTGAFLDQRENYAAATQYARGEALDVFCYQGGFALHLAKVCEKVTGVDSSRPALEMAERNAGLNGREIEWIEANAFDLLRDYSDQGRRFDCIVLDPPAFAKSRQNLRTALRGYKELNLRALKMLRPGGILVTCSCSYHVSPSDLIGVVHAAGLDSHRTLRFLENRSQAKDHPTVLGIPETAYLKCLIVFAS
jgi:23S rRNA (cytosine1962-C5)-methyltransferase